MRQLLIILCLLPAALQAQQVQSWWFANSTWDINIIPADGDMICVGVRDSAYGTAPIPQEYRSKLSLHRLLPDGTVRSQELTSEGPMYKSATDGPYARFDCAASSTAGGDILIAAAKRRYFKAVGVGLSLAGPLRLYLLRDGKLSLLDEWPGCMNGRLLRTSRGSFWLAWEKAEGIDSDSADGRYVSTIQVVHITAQLQMGAVVDVGPGFDPRLAEREDGAVFVLRTTAMHSRAHDGLGLRLRRIDTPSTDITLADGFEAANVHTSLINTQSHFLAGRDNSLHVVWNTNKQLTYFYCDSAMHAEIGGTSIGSCMAFVKDADGDPVMFGKRREGENLSWSSAADGRLFRFIDHIPHTSRVYSLTAHLGTDNRIKLLYNTGYAVSDTLYAVRNALAPDAAPVAAYVLPEGRWGLKNWLFDRDHTLWLYHYQAGFTGPRGSGVYAVRGITLDGKRPPPAATALRITDAYPQPVSTRTRDFRVVVDAPSEQRATLSLLSVLGHERKKTVSLLPGENVLRMETAGLAPGVHVLVLRAPPVLTSRMILVQ